MKLVDDTDSSDGMFNDGQVGGAQFNQGLLQYRFTQSARLTMPVLVIAGGADYQAVVDPVRPFVARLRRGRLVEYPGHGHFMFVEEPERFARDVTRFLKER
jgi:proline iminopeptidase